MPDLQHRIKALEAGKTITLTGSDGRKITITGPVKDHSRSAFMLGMVLAALGGAMIAGALGLLLSLLR